MRTLRLLLPFALGCRGEWEAKAWWEASTSGAARAQYDPAARRDECASSSARQRAWRVSYERARWVPGAADGTSCEPRSAPCVEDSLSGCCARGPAAAAPPRSGAFVAVSLATSDAACAVRAAARDLLAVAAPSTVVAVHVGCYSRATDGDRAALAAAFPGRVVLNPDCVPVLRAYGSILHAHLRNVMLLDALYGARGPSHVVFSAANVEWRNPGFEALVRDRGASAARAPAFASLAAINKTVDGDDGDWAAIAEQLPTPRVLLQKHEGAFYAFATLRRAVAFLAARGPLGRLNARTCLDCGHACVEELYLPNLARVVDGDGGARCDAPGPPPGCRLWDGTLATRDVYWGESGEPKFAAKRAFHRGCGAEPRAPVSRFDCRGDGDCDASRGERCVGRRDDLAAWPGQCVVEAPPAPWAWTCEYAYPAAGGAATATPVDGGENGCVALTVGAAPPPAAGPRGAVVVAGLADGLEAARVHGTMADCFLRSTGGNWDVFANLELAPDTKTFMREPRWNHGSKRVAAADLATALGVLRPRMVTLREPRVPRSRAFDRGNTSSPTSSLGTSRGSAASRTAATSGTGPTGIAARAATRTAAAGRGPRTCTTPRAERCASSTATAGPCSS